MDFGAIERKMGIENMNVYDAVRNVRWGLQCDDPAVVLARSHDLMQMFGVTDFETLGLAEDATRARLFATAMVSIVKQDSGSFNLDKVLEAARIKVVAVERMTRNKQVLPRAPGLPCEPVLPRVPAGAGDTTPTTDTPTGTTPTPTTGTKARFNLRGLDLSKAIDIYEANRNAKPKVISFLIGQAYDVDSSRGYDIFYKVRKMYQ
jgi:hypothetical protein